MNPSARTAGMRTMRRIATGLLVAATVVYVIAGFFEPAHRWVGFVRAFAEAAMVGALADWFAVTALFRRPLGLPIPHTAVIPRNKDRLGQGLGRFVEENFLAPPVIAERLESADIAGSIARWVTTGNNSVEAASGTLRALRTLAGSIPEEDVQRILRDYIAGRLQHVKLAPLVGEILGQLMAEQQHRGAVDAVLRKAAELMRDYEPEMRVAVHERSSWLWRRFGIDQKIADRLITVLEETLAQAAEDPEHTLRMRIEQVLEALAERLRSSTEFLEAGERLKARLLEHPAFDDYLRDATRDLLAQIAAHATHSEVGGSARVAAIARNLAEAILVDASLRAQLNRLARAAIGRLFELQRFQVAQLISDTVAKWDAEMVSNRLETVIGRDLQYIRINGALIGGLVGLVIHTVSIWVHP